MTEMEKRLARRIHNQRKRIAWFEALEKSWGTHWRHRALAYRRQLEQAGIKPDCVWLATYRAGLPADHYTGPAGG